MFVLAKVHDEVVVDKDGAKGFKEKATEPPFGLTRCFVRGAAQADLWRRSSAATDIILVLPHYREIRCSSVLTCWITIIIIF